MTDQGHTLPKPTRQRGWRRWLKVLLLLGCLGFLAFNAVCYQHAWHLTHFTPGPPTKQSFLEQLAFGRKMPRPINRSNPSSLGLHYETVRFTSEPGVDIEAWNVPHTQPRFRVALFHGHAGSKSDMLPTAVELHQMGGQVLLVDFRGSGGSSGDVTSIGWNEAKDVQASAAWLRDHSNQGLPMGMLGASMGAVAIMRCLALQSAEVDFIILECPFATMRSTVGHRFEHYGLPSWGLAEGLVFWGGQMHGYNAFDHNPVSYASSIRIPSLLMYGAQDHTTSTVEFQEIAKALGHQGAAVCFEKLGHQSFLGAEPEKWRDSIGCFLRPLLQESP